MYAQNLNMNIQKNLQLAFQLFNQQNYDEALSVLNKVIKKDPKHPMALSNKGLILIKIGKIDEAVESFKKSLQYKFDLKVMFNLITLLIELKDWQQASFYNKKLINYQNHPQVLINQALILRGEEKFEDAINIYDKLIEAFSENLDLYVSKGFILNQLGSYEKAIDVYKRALEINSGYYAAIYNLGITLNNNQNYHEAIGYLKKALEINPSNVDAWLTLAAAQVKENLMDDARFSIDKAASVDNYKNEDVLIEAKFQSALVELNDKTNFKETERLLSEIIEMRPDHVEANFHMGITYLKQHKYSRLLEFYRYRTLRKDRFGRYDDFNLPVIDSTTKLLIGGEQGIGDQLILVRLLPIIRNRVADLKYGSYNKLAKFLKYNYQDQIDIFSEDELKKIENTALLDYTKINLFTIFNYLPDVEKLITKIKPMRCDEHLKKIYQKKYKKDNRPLIGISWKSNVDKIGKIKSLKLTDLKEVLEESEKFSFVNLQYGDVKEEINNINKNKKINIQLDDKLDYFNDIYSLASLVAACDVVITCSNITAHIAGSLGVKTYVVVPQTNAKLWYWFSDNRNSKWYPSVTPINQLSYRDWSHPIAEIRKELTEMTNK